MTTIRIVANRLSPPQIEPLPPAPATAAATPIAAATPRPRPIAEIVHAGVVPSAPVSAIAPHADVKPQPPLQPPPLKAAEVPLPIAQAKAPPTYRLPWPAPRPQRATQPPRAAKKVAHQPPRPTAAAPGAANPSTCTITVGSRPWSELWIDGRRTGRHTPYTGDIACGRHNLTFKRPDLDIIKSATVTLYPGEPFKESFALK